MTNCYSYNFRYCTRVGSCWTILPSHITRRPPTSPSVTHYLANPRFTNNYTYDSYLVIESSSVLGKYYSNATRHASYTALTNLVIYMNDKRSVRTGSSLEETQRAAGNIVDDFKECLWTCKGWLKPSNGFGTEMCICTTREKKLHGTFRLKDYKISARRMSRITVLHG